MKKILSFTLVLILLFGVCVSVGAVEANTELEQKFYNYCLEVLPEDMKPSGSDKVKINVIKELNGATYFHASCEWLGFNSSKPTVFFGDDVVIGNSSRSPYDLGIYMSSGDEILTLEESYEAGYITDITLLKPEFSGWFRFAKKHVSDPDNKYEDEVFRIMHYFDYPAEEGWEQFTYYEGYEYFSPDNTATDDEATPDFVVIHLSSNMVGPMFTADVFGDYIMEGDNWYFPFKYGYGIYVPKSQQVYDLTKAYDLGVQGVYKLFTERNFGKLIGDMDYDRKLTIKDATAIQKCLAGLSDNFGYINAYNASENPPLIALSDFDRDCEVTIKDATAIQKHIAGLEY